jgi:5,5'-dehydrodivanillate O-demethylase oxygenase subunit
LAVRPVHGEAEVLSVEENAVLTQVGPETPGGELLRRYWHPIAAAADLQTERVLPIRVLGEDLVLYRSGNGDFGLVDRRCPHRSLSLTLGWTEDEGIRCAYHGWYFNKDGQCIAQPYEDTVGGGTFKERVKITAYPVEELGGLLWTYLGPQPIPLLPKWEVLVRENADREIAFTTLPCNWVQIAENGLDPVHVEWLHVNQSNLAASLQGRPPVVPSFRHLKIDFAPFEYGIYKRRLIEGDPEDSRDWTVGHPLIFPGILAQEHMFQFRTPVDDTHTLHIVYTVHSDGSGKTVCQELPYEDENGRPLDEYVVQQDFSAWIGQGDIAPRNIEKLGRSDRGIVLYRQMLQNAIDAVQQGLDPIGVIRDPAMNEPSVRLEYEGKSPHTTRLGDSLQFAGVKK